jgi:hypothetical protein
MRAVGLVLLFVFAVAVFGFVAYVWQSADQPAPYVPRFPTTTAVPAP